MNVIKHPLQRVKFVAEGCGLLIDQGALGKEPWWDWIVGEGL